jgi:hypothetical protein
MVAILQKIFRIIRYPGGYILVIFFLAGRTVVAQSNIWPEYLNVPESTIEEKGLNDSNWLRFDNKLSWYETAKELNTIDWRVETTKYSFAQTSQYLLKMDNRESREHTYSLPGSILRKNVLVPTGKLGVEWVPKLSYKVRADSSTYHSTVDFGPVAEVSAFSIPVQVRTGISTDVWDEAMKSKKLFSVFQDYSWDAGYYLEGEFGDYSKPVFNVPLFFTLRASGRSIRDAGLGLIMGNALYTNDLGSGDSIVIYISDSISNGKESYLNQGTTFTTSPWRILHNFSMTGGIKGAERLGFRPSGYYSYNFRTIKYPAGTDLYNDLKGKVNKVGLQISTQNRYFFNYNGGIEMGWSDQDWMYNSKNIKTRIVKYIGKDSLLNVTEIKEKMLATANNKDNQTFTASMDHNVVIPLLWKCNLLYDFQISRESKNYGNYYVYIEDGRVDTIRNQLESDGVDKFHHLEISRRDSSMFQGGAYCDYGKVAMYNLRKSLSGISNIRKSMKIGGFASFSLNKLYLSEDIFFQGQKFDYIFKKLHTEPSKRPQQQRDFYSLLSGAWTFNDNVTLLCSWNERYGDDGKWYGKEYVLDENEKKDYYAIQTKKNDYMVTMHIEMNFSYISFSAGGSFRDTYSQSYDAEDSVYIPVLEGYEYMPFLECETILSGFHLKLKIKRDFNTVDPERWSKYKNWDITFLLQKEW